MDNSIIRAEFPLLSKNLIYFDAAATSLKPESVISKEAEYNRELGVNTARGTGLYSFNITKEIEDIRDKTATYIGCSNSNQIIFTANTTDSINLVALSYVANICSKKSNIVISNLEHHSNYVPWVELCKRLNIECRIVDIDKINDNIDGETVITAVTGMSNLTGFRPDLKKIIEKCREYKSKIIVDGAQLLAHSKIDISELDIDFLCFSAHKIYGPFGLGFLYGKEELLKEFIPLKYGGNMVSYIGKNGEIHYKNIPHKLESGTQNPSAIHAFGSTLDFLEKYDLVSRELYILKLDRYLNKGLKDIGGITIYSTQGSITSFNINGVHPHDASGFFDDKNIILRTGNLCASPFFINREESGVIRISLGFYNNKREIDILLKTVREIKEFFI